MNTVILTGQIAGEPRTHTTTTGKSKIELRVNDGKFHHTVVGWEGVGEGVGEGDLVYVGGRLGYRSYENKDKVTIWVTEITAATIEIIGTPITDATEPTVDDDKDDLGF